MKTAPHRGFIMILVTVSLAILILSASIIVTLGCSELMATRVRNDMLVSAYYVAISGCELKYADMKATRQPGWGTPVSGTIAVGTNTIGTYSATATDMGSNTLAIVSNGTVGGHTATATVLLGYLQDYTGPLAVGSYGAVTLTGASNQAKLMMDGPAASSTSTVTLSGRVIISGDPQTINNSGVPKVSFWLGQTFDTTGDSNYAYDTNLDGQVTADEAAAQQMQAAFALDDANGDGVINERDAFVYYYTTYLNDPANNRTGQSLNIGAGQSRYYNGDQTFGTGSIPDSVPIIFVNGNCTITENDGATTDHTVVVTGNLTLYQPDNGPEDRNTYVVYGNVYTSGEMGHSGGTKGDLIIFANGNIDKQGGGKMNASIFANGTLNMNTAGDTGKKHLMLSRLTETWSGGNSPLGIPPGYPNEITAGFSVKNQTSFPPVWQRE
jgi:hypothetical protein